MEKKEKNHKKGGEVLQIQNKTKKIAKNKFVKCSKRKDQKRKTLQGGDGK